MNETEIVSAAQARPAKPSARRYYVWRAAMWFTIVHTALFGMFATIAIGWLRIFPEFSFSGASTLPLDVARAWTEPPVLPMLAGFLLVPIAVIACYRESMRKRAMGWLLGYWLSAATICVLSASALWVLLYCTGSKPSITLSDRYFAVNDAMGLCAICPPPLLITLLAALLTIERKKRPPSLEAGA